MKQPWDAVLWWEKRRMPYNFVLAAVGAISITIIEVIGSHYVNPGEDIEEPLGLILGAIFFLIVANLFYTLGWITEILWSWGDTTRTANMRFKVFKVGLLFSSFVTLLPAILVPALWMIFGFKHTD